MQLQFTEGKNTGCVRVFIDRDYEYGYWFDESKLSLILTKEELDQYYNYNKNDFTINEKYKSFIYRYGTTYNNGQVISFDEYGYKDQSGNRYFILVSDLDSDDNSHFTAIDKTKGFQNKKQFEDWFNIMVDIHGLDWRATYRFKYRDSYLVYCLTNRKGEEV